MWKGSLPEGNVLCRDGTVSQGRNRMGKRVRRCSPKRDGGCGEGCSLGGGGGWWW